MKDPQASIRITDETLGMRKDFLAGDTSYSEELLRERHADGVSPDAEVATQTMDHILRYAEAEPTVYLPTHDPRSAERLKHRQPLILAT